MDNQQRDQVLLDIQSNVGEIKGTVSSHEARLQFVESTKVGWRSFSAIQATFIASTAAVFTLFRSNP
jgi:hypothetical protein